MKKMFTRQQYLHKECSDREYYAQFVTQIYIDRVKHLKGNESVKIWDSLPLIYSYTNDLMKECNDYLTLAGKVCIYKEAHRQYLESLESLKNVKLN